MYLHPHTIQNHNTLIKTLSLLEIARYH